MYIAAVMTACFVAHSINSIIMYGIAPKQNAFKFKIAPHKQKSTIKNVFWQEDGPPLPTGPCA